MKKFLFALPLTLLAFLVLIAGILGILWQRRAMASKLEAEAQRRAAEQNLWKAKQAMDERNKPVKP